MTGIGRLRTLAGEWDAYGLGGTLEDVAGQIERELTCDEDTIENVRLIVGGVIDDMERHCLGHEGMEDSPVARWARELREALKSDASDGSDGEKPSCPGCHDATDATFGGRKVTREDAEAIAWVRKRGGLDHVRVEWNEHVPRDRYVRKRQRLLGHIAECETALGRRREVISNLGHRVSDLTTENAALRRRAMPEGCEWPRYESGELVGFGDEASRLGEVFGVSAICLYCDGSYALNHRGYSKGERIKRPSVPASDGEPLEVGQTVWGIGRSQHEFEVLALNDVNPEVGDRFSVKCFDRDDDEECWCDPKLLTHTKPVPPDSWERIEADVMVDAKDYCESRGISPEYPKHGGKAKCEDIVRRCRALAERERGE